MGRRSTMGGEWEPRTTVPNALPVAELFTRPHLAANLIKYWEQDTTVGAPMINVGALNKKEEVQELVERICGSLSDGQHLVIGSHEPLTFSGEAARMAAIILAMNACTTATS